MNAITRLVLWNTLDNDIKLCNCIYETSEIAEGSYV